MWSISPVWYALYILWDWLRSFYLENLEFLLKMLSWYISFLSRKSLLF